MFSTYSEIKYLNSNRSPGKDEMDKADIEEEASYASMNQTLVKQESSLNDCKSGIQNSEQCQQIYLSSEFQSTHEIEIEKETNTTKQIQGKEEVTNEAQIPVYAVVNKAKKTSRRQCDDKLTVVAKTDSELRNESEEMMKYEPFKASVPEMEDCMYKPAQEESTLPVYAEVVIKKKVDKSKMMSDKAENNSTEENGSSEYDKLVFTHTRRPRDRDEENEHIEKHHYSRLEIPFKGNDDAGKENIKTGESSGTEETNTCQPAIDDKSKEKGNKEIAVAVKEETGKVVKDSEQKGSNEYDKLVFTNTRRPRDQGEEKEEIEKHYYNRLDIPSKGKKTEVRES